jgi:hypothetical protein
MDAPPPQQAAMIAALQPAPAPKVVNGGGTVMPKTYAPETAPLAVQGGDAAETRRLLDAAVGAWGGKPQTWNGWTVHYTPDVIDADRNGRSVIRKRDGQVIGGQMDLQQDRGMAPNATALAHEVGHILLGGDPDHRDARWHSRSFWQKVEKATGAGWGTLDKYRVDE